MTDVSISTIIYQEILSIFNQTKEAINDELVGVEPWFIIFVTVSTMLCCQWIYSSLFDDTQSLSKRITSNFFYYVKKLPIVRGYVKKQVDAVLSGISARKLFPLKPGQSYLQNLPLQGKNKLELTREVENYLMLDDVNWCEGKVSGTVYGGDPELTNIISDVYHKFAWSNPLHADVFKSQRKMEAEIVRMACDLFRGDPVKSCGSVTSGGTESILLACKTYRDWAYDKGIKKPELVCPVSAHATFDKACHYFKIKLVHVPVDPITRKVDLHAMKRAISRNTCMLVGSTPQFPHGIVDPIPEIAKLGLQNGIPVHVDSCLGGFLLPFLEEAGYPLHPCDFSLAGVTSISADTHKYGYAPKGSSVILYSSKKWIHYQYFVSPDWQGGIYATPTVGGSRSGAVIAACWATMIHIGREGYISKTRSIISTARYIQNGLRSIPNIFVFGEPKMSVIAIGSHDFDVFHLSSALVQRGWNLNNLQFPPSIHLCCTLPHTKPGVADLLIHDVKESVAIIMQAPSARVTGAGAMYGMAQTVPDRSIVSEIASTYLDACYDATGVSSIANGVN